jgi:Leucine-rich repeat (LRR) protein
MDICGLIWLRYLGLKWASIDALPGDIGNLRNLETLDVRRTRISKLPTGLEKLQHLRTMNISDTNITELPKDIEKLQNLETLDISGTKVTELPREIGKLQNLETLNASKTSVTVLPTEIEKLKYLKTLNVSGTKVREVPKEIGKLEYLRTLDISYTKVKDLPREITKLERLENLDIRNTCVMELPKEMRKLQRLRTLDVRGTKVRDLHWEVQNPLNVHFGGLCSVKMLKFPLTVTPDRFTSCSGANCRGALSIVFLYPFNARCEQPIQVPVLRVNGRHMKLPQWVKQDLCNVCSLDISLCKLVQQDLEFLKTQMQNLQSLQLRLEVLPRDLVAITRGGFSKLETFSVDCRLPRVVTFEEGAMPKLKHLEFKFYNGGSARQCYSMGIKHLDSLESIVFRCSENYKSDSQGIGATIEAMRKEATEHPNCITLYFTDRMPEVFRSGAKWISQADRAIIQKENEERARILEQREHLCSEDAS